MRKRKTAGIIINYLKETPEGADSLEGITTFWIEFEKINLAADEVSEAIKYLLKKNKITTSKRNDGTLVYKAC